MQAAMVSFQNAAPLCLTALLLLLTIFFSACQTGKEDLDTYIQNGEIEKVSQFAISNLSLDEKDPRVVHAIELLSEVRADTVLARLATLTTPSVPTQHTEALITALHTREVEREDGFYLCEMAVEGNLASGDVTQAYLAHQGSQKLRECITASNLASNAVENPDYIVSSVSALAQITDVGDELRAMKSTAEELYDARVSLQDKERDLIELEDEKKDVQETLDVVRGRLDNIQTLAAFVIGLQERTSEGDLYEIAFLERGRPSSNRAYLLTKETQFKTKGRFTMPVIRGSNVETRLRDEYGGFRQSWPLFVESTSYSFLQEALQNGIEEQRNLNSNLESLLREEQRLRRKTSQLERELERQINTAPRAPDANSTDESTSDVPITVRVEDRSLPVVSAVTVDGQTFHIVRDESESVRRLISSDINLDTTFSLDTAIGPFYPATGREGVYFQTADSAWTTYHYWNPEKDLHVWRSEGRRSNTTGESSNSQSHPSIVSQLESRPDPSLDYLEGNKYSEVRQAILSSGWVPVQADYESYVLSAERVMADKGWIELQMCAGTGLNPCRFEFERPTGEKLVVITEGESEDPSVRSIFAEN